MVIHSCSLLLSVYGSAGKAGISMTCIMVVEDEGPIREMIVEVLCEEGFQIIEAASADDAVELPGNVELEAYRN